MVSGIASREPPTEEAAAKISAAKAIIAGSWPFLTGIVWRLVVRWTTRVPTIGVDDQWRMYVNPDWILTQHTGTLALIIAGHELGHLFGHHSQRLLEYQDKMVASDHGCPCSLANLANDLL